MKLSLEELKKLENLSCIKLDNEEEFQSKLSGIIDFLWQLKNVKLDKTTQSQTNVSIQPNHDIENFEDKDMLLDNVQHDKVNRAISINKIN